MAKLYLYLYVKGASTQDAILKGMTGSMTRKKSPNVYKSCPKMILLENFKVLIPLQKLPKNKGDLGKLIVAKGFKKLPNVQ